MSSRRAGPVPSHPGEVDDHGDVLVAASGVSPHVLIDTEHAHVVEPVGVLDQHPSAFGEDRIVRGVPRHIEAFSYPGDAQVRHHDPFQRPPQTAP